jgi:uncharacterized membrane protein YcaP (DUF421 family)
MHTKSDLPMPLILDSVIQLDTLDALGKDIFWMNKILDKEQVPLDNIFYAFLKKHKVYIIKKD